MQTEKAFKKTMIKIGTAMLLFLAFFNTLGTIYALIDVFASMTLSPTKAYVFSQLFYAAIYLTSFMVPAVILNKMMGKERVPMMFEKKLPLDFAAYIFAAIGMILTVAIINSKIVDALFDYSKYSSEVLWGNQPLSAYQTILAFITTAIVPAICEEFLFRGAILSALKPYGKAPAIIISAVLFGLMHQNIEQLIYTTVAGIVLAWVVYETGAIWCSVLIHFYNNFTGVFETALYDRLPIRISDPIIIIFEATLFVLGVICTVYLIVKRSKQKRTSKILEEGIYGRPIAESPAENALAERPLPPGKLVKRFFSPTIIVFIVLSVLTMLLNILLSFMYAAGYYG